MALHNDIFRDQIWEFFSNDLESCLQVSQIKQIFPQGKLFPGGLNFTAALVIFSAIDLLAGYFAGKEPTIDDIAKFISKYVGKYESKFDNNEVLAKRWYRVFRNELSHQWSPKFGGVGMDFKDIDTIYLASHGSEEIPIINVPSLFVHLKKAFVDFEKDLDGDEKMQIKFKKRYESIVKKDLKEMKLFREMWNKKN